MVAQLPPVVSGGLPVIGHAIEMMRDREKLFKRGGAEHGDLFAIKLGPQYALVVTGAEHNRQFYQETDKALNMQDGYQFLKEAIGEVLFTAGPEKYYNQRPVLQETFRRERMTGYIQAMNIEVQRWLDSLGESGEIDIVAEMLKLTQNVAGRSFVGPNFREELGEDFWRHYSAISASLDPILPPNLPLPKFKRRDQAKQIIKGILTKSIQVRRANPDQYDDLISTLMTTPLKDGQFLTEDEIVTTFTGLIFAGHETTAGQAAWTVALLLQHPDYLARVQAEIKATVRYGTAIDATTLSKLEHIYWAIDETGRLRPSADMQIRTVSKPLTVGNYTIPAGWRMMVNAANSHFATDVFKNPDQYDPLRFSPEHDEGKNSFAIVGFGGGIHKCTGMNFAKNEMAVITALLFQQFDITLLSQEIHVVSGQGANHPSVVKIKYRRKPLRELTDEATIREAVAAGCPHISQRVAG